MKYFVYSGKRRVNLSCDGATFLYRKVVSGDITRGMLTSDFRSFLGKNHSIFSGKKVCVVIPDNTREYHPKTVLPVISTELKKISKKTDFIISTGLHRTLNTRELEGFLGKDFIGGNIIRQHSLKETIYAGVAGEVPVYLNKNIFLYDLIFTVGVVEPHLYAGFSGGVKCIGIGLGGKKTILYTHSIKFLSRRGVRVANIEGNPFQKFVWAAAKRIAKPVYSLNLVNDLNKKINRYSLGKARASFLEIVKYARDIFGYEVKKQFDILFVGCDAPKDRVLYQASRLFNYVLERKPLVKKGGAIFVFADLDGAKKSDAEANFEKALGKPNLPGDYEFKRPGEHRAFKVIEASGYARLGIIARNLPERNFKHVSFFKDHRSALEWYKDQTGNKGPEIGIVPLGFSFIPY